MSQEKVDRYKKEKANRKQIMKWEKIRKYVSTVAACVICVLVIGWIGYSSYSSAQANKEVVRESVSIDTSALDEYLAGIETE